MSVFQVILLDIGSDEQKKKVVREKIGKIFKLSPEKVEKLTSKLPRLVASGLKKRSAERYVKAFKNIGAMAEMRLAMDDEELKTKETNVKTDTDSNLTHRQIILASVGKDTNLQYKLRESIAPILEISKQQTIQLTTKIPTVLKKHLSPQKAEAIAHELKREGVTIEIRPDTPPPAKPSVRLETTDFTREYITCLLNSGISRSTLQHHLLVLNALEQFMGNADITNVSEEEIRDFQNCFVKRLPDARDITYLKSILQTYYSFLVNKGYISNSPVPASVIPRKDLTFHPRSLELNPDDMRSLESASDVFVKTKPGILNVLLPFAEPEKTDDPIPSLSLQNSFQKLPLGIQSLIITGISSLILIIVLLGLSSFKVFTSRDKMVWNKESFFQIQRGLVEELQEIKNWYVASKQQKSKLKNVETIYDLGLLIQKNKPSAKLDNLSTYYIFHLYSPVEGIFMFRNKNNRKKLLVLNTNLREVYIFNNGLSKKLYSW